jgi:hypothetical protein
MSFAENGTVELRSQYANKGERLKFTLPLLKREWHLRMQNGEVSSSAKK